MADDARPEAFDPDVLRDKYRAERDKRVRTESNDQYVNMAGDFAHFINDPYWQIRARATPVTQPMFEIGP